MSFVSKENKRRRRREAAEERPKTMNAVRVICGDRVKVSNSFLEVCDVKRAGETMKIEFHLAKGGTVERTYHINEPVEIEEQ